MASYPCGRVPATSFRNSISRRWMWALWESTRWNWGIFPAIYNHFFAEKERHLSPKNKLFRFSKKENKSNDFVRILLFRQTPTHIQVHNLVSVREITKVESLENILWRLDFLSPFTEHSGLHIQVAGISSHFSQQSPVFLLTFHVLPCYLELPLLFPEFWTLPVSTEILFQHKNSMECICLSTRDLILGPLIDFKFGVRNLWLKPRNLYNIL